MSTLFLCTFQSCCFIFRIAAQSACFRHNKIITKEYVPYEYTGIRKLSGKISHGNPLFPYITYLCSIPLDFSYVPIHWHDEMEIIYIKKGHGIITVDFTQYQVSAGTLALIIPGQLHSIEQYENESMEYENIIFHPQILLSKQTDTCSTDYFSPLMDGTLTIPVLYQPGDPYYKEISACVDANDEISKTNPPAYQLFIKSQLFMLFYILFNKCSSRNAQKKDYKSLEK